MARAGPHPARAARRYMIDASEHAILVAHDDVQARCDLALTLRAAGFQTVQAGTGRTALKFAEHVSAALIHARLPDLDGPEVCRILRSRPATARLPIVRLWTPDHGAEPHGDVVDACIATPAERGVLEETVVQLLTRNRM